MPTRPDNIGTQYDVYSNCGWPLRVRDTQDYVTYDFTLNSYWTGKSRYRPEMWSYMKYRGCCELSPEPPAGEQPPAICGNHGWLRHCGCGPGCRIYDDRHGGLVWQWPHARS